MKHFFPLTTLFLFFLLGCDKENPAPVKPPQDVVKEGITAAVGSQSDLSDFADAFKDLQLEPEDVANGITVFAPANENSGGRLSGSQQVVALTPEILKGHIVKGLLAASDLKEGDVLESLNGKDLVVSVDGEEIRLNGVLISLKDMVTNDQFIIHKVEEVIGEFQEPGSISVTVWNSLLWSSANPKGQPEAGVAVSFYASRADYPNGNAVFSAETDGEGKVVFPNAEPGATYYILAQKGDISNVFNRSLEPVDGVYYGFFADGIFQSLEEINGYVVQPGAAIGDLRWRDLNMDGIINNDDRGALPHPNVTAVAGGETSVEVFIGYDDNDAMFIRDEEDAYATLRSCLGRTYAMYKTVVMMDGILSDDALCQEATEWCAIDDYTLNSANTRVLRFWDLGYSNIEEINLILRDVPGLAINGKELMIAEAKALRALTYLQLVSYFGDVPIPDDVWLTEAQSRNPKSEVYALITADLESARDIIPAGPSADRSTLSSDAARVLLAKTALLKGDFSVVEALTAELIESARYELVGSTEEAFADNTNSEIIWDLSFGYNEEFTQYFFGRSFGPALRLAQVYLMRAEAQIELNNLEGGRASLDIIRGRLGLSPASGMTVNDLRIELRDTWKLEMSREGDRFINLVRWNLAEETLSVKGYDPSKHSLLPLPQVVMDKYYNMFQNPGY